jgi:hypothetical protein
VSVFGVVINVNSFGATVRLDDGDLAGAAFSDVEAHRREYEQALGARSRMAFVKHGGGRRPSVTLAPQISDDRLEQQISSYLKSTEETWESSELPEHERHFLRKKKRAAHWEAKSKT